MFASSLWPEDGWRWRSAATRRRSRRIIGRTSRGVVGARRTRGSVRRGRRPTVSTPDARAAVGGGVARRGVDAGRAHQGDVAGGARRSGLVGARTRIKNEIHAVLIRRLIAGRRGERPVRPGGRRWLAGLRAPARGARDARQCDAPDRVPRHRDRPGRRGSPRRPAVARAAPADERPRGERICAASFLAAIGPIEQFKNPRKLVGYLGLDPKVRQSGPGPGTSGRISKRAPPRALGAGRSALERGRAARADARVLPAHPCPPRPPGRRRRRRAQARVSVLVPAQPRRGLRLPAALADPQEAATPGDRRRLTRSTQAARTSGRPTSRCARPNASSPNRLSSPTATPSATGKQRRRKSKAAATVEVGASRHRGAHQTGPRRAKPRGRPQAPDVCASLRQSLAPTQRSHTPAIPATNARPRPGSANSPYPITSGPSPDSLTTPHNAPPPSRSTPPTPKRAPPRRSTPAKEIRNAP